MYAIAVFQQAELYSKQISIPGLSGGSKLFEVGIVEIAVSLQTDSRNLKDRCFTQRRSSLSICTFVRHIPDPPTIPGRTEECLNVTLELSSTSYQLIELTAPFWTKPALCLRRFISELPLVRAEAIDCPWPCESPRWWPREVRTPRPFVS
jgi:hypothetical protein